MEFSEGAYFARPEGLARRGAVFVDVPILYPPREGLATVWLNADRTLGRQDFETAYRTSDDAARQRGLLVLARAKPRPVILLAPVERAAPTAVAWVLPVYSVTEAEQEGPNVFRLPAAPRFGLGHEHYADIYRTTGVPLPYLRPDRYRCDLTRAARLELLQHLWRCLGGAARRPGP